MTKEIQTLFTSGLFKILFTVFVVSHFLGLNAGGNFILVYTASILLFNLNSKQAYINAGLSTLIVEILWWVLSLAFN